MQAWLEDGEHFLQVKNGRLYKVHALSGRVQAFHDPEKLAKGLGSLPTFDRQKAQTLAQGTLFQMNPQRTGAFFEHGNDLYFCNFDGTGAVRLTKTPAEYRHSRGRAREAPYEALLGAGRTAWEVGERVRYYRAAGGRYVGVPETDDEADGEGAGRVDDAARRRGGRPERAGGASRGGGEAA